MKSLKYIELDHFELCSGRRVNLRLSYQVFGKDLGSAPIVLVNHALTGNSQVSGENGWWNTIIGHQKVIDTTVYSVLAFNCPGNGFGLIDENFVNHYEDFKARDIARMYSEALIKLNIYNLYAIIGASVGGGLTWELAALRPNLADYIIPIAADWKSTDWIISNCYIQDSILKHSSQPLVDARMHAMTLYRTPESLSEKFKRSKASTHLFNSESWLQHHGKKLQYRLKLSAYKMMNQILKTIDVTNASESFTDVVKHITAHIHIVTINSDLLFKPEENWNTFVELKLVKENVTIGEIKSIHGHDAFFIEHQQVIKLLKPIFKIKRHKHENHKPSYIRNW